MADDDARLWEKDHGYDADGHQQKTACRTVTGCPVCGKEVELVADTVSWTQADDGRWDHSEFGPAQGVCCNRLIVDLWDGCRIYNLSQADDEDQDDDAPDDDSDDSELTPLESEAVEEQRQRSEAIARTVRADGKHDLGGESG